MKLYFILLNVGLLGFAIPYSLWAQSPALKIEVGLKSDTLPLHEEEAPSTATITVVGRIQNLTQENLFLWTITCSYLDAWITDNKAISIAGQSCRSNFPIYFTLKPGEVREETIPLHISTDIPAGDIHFRLGYKAQRAIFDPKNIPHDLRRAKLEGAPFWSKEIVLHPRLASEAQ